MARLRIRIELNRRMAGVPLDKMAKVVEETRKFLFLLAEDVQIEAGRGDWLASDFDADALNFTAEYAGPVSPEQVRAFGAAFSGATSLRKTTIAQFTRIAEFLGEDELVGFGLYQSDQEPEPTEWRCLSKRDAMRFGEEIRLLAQAAGEHAPETQLPAVMSGSVAGRRLFKDRREREALAADPSKLVRELESNLARRIGLLEEEVAEQTRRMQQIKGNPDAAEEKFQRLLAAMETFWAQAPRQFAQLPPATGALASEPRPAAPASETRAELPDELRAGESHVTPEKRPGWSALGIAAAGLIAVLAGLAFPEMQRQWVRFAALEKLPIVKVKAPAPPALPAISAPAANSAMARKAARPVALPRPLVASRGMAAPRPMVKTVLARSPEPFTGPLIPLDIPAKVKSKIQTEVRVDVVVGIDREGNVTSARVASTKGDSAQLLVTEALRAAKQSRFRPAREGENAVSSEMVLTFLFKPDSDEF
jgi:hypothetical protein